jgi:putative effector of murein hydrolase
LYNTALVPKYLSLLRYFLVSFYKTRFKFSTASTIFFTEIPLIIMLHIFPQLQKKKKNYDDYEKEIAT